MNEKPERQGAKHARDVTSVMVEQDTKVLVETAEASYAEAKKDLKNAKSAHKEKNKKSRRRQHSSSDSDSKSDSSGTPSSSESTESSSDEKRRRGVD